MPTRKQIEDLKTQWVNDPCWDLEYTDGFEEHEAELKEFAEKQRKLWSIERVMNKIEVGDIISTRLTKHLYLVTAKYDTVLRVEELGSKGVALLEPLDINGLYKNQKDW